MINRSFVFLILFLYCVFFKVSASVTCLYYPSSNIVQNISCSYACCQGTATSPYQACCSNTSAISITYLITFGLLLGCCSLFSLIGFIISCCKYERCRCRCCSTRIFSSRSAATSTESNNRGYSSSLTSVDLPPSYSDIVKPQNNNDERNNQDKERSSPPPPYRINVIPIDD